MDWLATHIDEVDGVVCDMDGVLILGDERLPQSREFLAWMQERQLPFMLLTNDGSRSKEQRSRLLERRGILLEPEYIVCSSDGLQELVESRPELRQFRYYIIGKLGKPCYADAAGLDSTFDLDQLDACGGVIMGEGEELFDWESTFTRVINFFCRHPGAPLIVPNPDEYYGVGAGELRVGAGGQARFIQHVLTVHRTPADLIYLGKPFSPIYEHVHHQLESRAGHPLERSRIVMLGDSLHSDIQGGHDFGYRTSLLLTGVTRQQMLVDHATQPDLVCWHL